MRNRKRWQAVIGTSNMLNAYSVLAFVSRGLVSHICYKAGPIVGNESSRRAVCRWCAHHPSASPPLKTVVCMPVRGSRIAGQGNRPATKAMSSSSTSCVACGLKDRDACRIIPVGGFHRHDSCAVSRS